MHGVCKEPSSASRGADANRSHHRAEVAQTSGPTGSLDDNPWELLACAAGLSRVSACHHEGGGSEAVQILRRRLKDAVRPGRLEVGLKTCEPRGV